MKHVRHVLAGLVFALSAIAARGQALEARLEAVLQTPGYQPGHWGILVVDARTGKTLIERDADQLFSPASVTKLFTTAAALAELGPDYRFRTPVVRRGEVDPDGTLQGDLILVAQGDLCLGGRTGPDGALLFEDHDHTYANDGNEATLVECDPLAGLDHLARAVREAGIKAVTGDVLIDDRLFDPALSTGSGPRQVTPILINDNVVDLVLSPGACAGDAAGWKMVPQTSYLGLDVQVETAPKDGKPEVEIRAVSPRQYAVRGKVPLGPRPILKVIEIDDPASFARALLIETLRRRGVKVSASPMGRNTRDPLPSRDAVKQLPEVADYTSPPFREFVRVILKVSHNLHASTLPVLVAVRHGRSTLGAGLKQEAKFLKGLGVPVETISFGGGAGGDRADLVTPRATVALLRAMADRPEFPAFEAALPVLGRDGTLAEAVAADSPARGHARAKTGTYTVRNRLTGKAVLTSKALAGYMETASGRTLAFAFFVNNVPLDPDGAKGPKTATDAGKLLGKLCEVLYTSDSAGPSKKEGAEARSDKAEPKP